jgi:hypothetical protein
MDRINPVNGQSGESDNCSELSFPVPYLRGDLSETYKKLLLIYENIESELANRVLHSWNKGIGIQGSPPNSLREEHLNLLQEYLQSEEYLSDQKADLSDCLSALLTIPEELFKADNIIAINRLWGDGWKLEIERLREKSFSALKREKILEHLEYLVESLPQVLSNTDQNNRSFQNELSLALIRDIFNLGWSNDHILPLINHKQELVDTLLLAMPYDPETGQLDLKKWQECFPMTNNVLLNQASELSFDTAKMLYLRIHNACLGGLADAHPLTFNRSF